ncbi:MAG: tetratricopeptide repeat protein [Planctomycetaceae bacterium]
MYQKSVDVGDSFAELQLGGLYERGLGVLKNDAKAAELFHLASSKGNIDATVRLGVLYLEGRGENQDYEKAQSLLKIGVFSGNELAEYYLGVLYLDENSGDVDQETAFQLISSASQKGLAIAKTRLASMYVDGTGVEVDYGPQLSSYMSRQLLMGLIQLQLDLLSYMKREMVFLRITQRLLNFMNPQRKKDTPTQNIVLH